LELESLFRSQVRWLLELGGHSLAEHSQHQGRLGRPPFIKRGLCGGFRTLDDRRCRSVELSAFLA
jgi:hypothetical protein